MLDCTASYCLSYKNLDSITCVSTDIILTAPPPHERTLYFNMHCHCWKNEYTHMSDSSLQCLQSYHWYFSPKPWSFPDPCAYNSCSLWQSMCNQTDLLESNRNILLEVSLECFGTPPWVIVLRKERGWVFPSVSGSLCVISANV